MITETVVAVYLILFVGLCFYHQQFQWLWASVLLWLGFSTIVGNLMLPNVFHFTQFNSMIFPYFYIGLGSLFYFTQHYAQHKDQQHSKNIGMYLPFLATSSLAMSASYLLLLGMFWMSYPQGSSSFFLFSQLQMYFLQPVYWIGAQWFLMATMLLYAKIFSKGQPLRLTAVQWQLMVLFSIIYQLAYLYWDVSNFMKIWY